MSRMGSFSLNSFRKSKESKGLFYLVVLTPFFLGLLHHFDHIVRGNHVGWPFAAEVTPFTFSLAVYPLALFGLYLMYFTDRDVTGYWVGFFGFSSVLVSYTHTFIEPPGHIINPHGSSFVGYLALLLAVVLSGSLIFGFLYSFREWKNK